MARLTWLLICLVPLGACEWSYERMIDQPKYDTYEPNPYLPARATMQPPPEGTVSREAIIAPAPAMTGLDAGGRYASTIPIEVDRALLARGRARFEVYCAACHGLLGDGQSEVAENMRQVMPPSFHTGRQRDYPPGRIFAVATNGYGLMPAYGHRLTMRDRWAVVAYIDVLQLSQRVAVDRLPAEVAEEAHAWLK